MANTDANICVTCELCGMYGNLLLCSGCRSSWYCSKEHQKTHWNIHRDTCRSRIALVNQQLNGFKPTQQHNQPQYGFTNVTQQYNCNSQPMLNSQHSLPNNQYNHSMGPVQSYSNGTLANTNDYLVQREYQAHLYANIPLQQPVRFY